MTLKASSAESDGDEGENRHEGVYMRAKVKCSSLAYARGPSELVLACLCHHAMRAQAKLSSLAYACGPSELIIACLCRNDMRAQVKLSSLAYTLGPRELVAPCLYHHDMRAHMKLSLPANAAEPYVCLLRYVLNIPEAMRKPQE